MYSSSLHFYLNFSNFYRLKKRTLNLAERYYLLCV